MIDPELLWLWVFPSFKAAERPRPTVIYTLKKKNKKPVSTWINIKFSDLIKYRIKRKVKST